MTTSGEPTRHSRAEVLRRAAAVALGLAALPADLGGALRAGAARASAWSAGTASLVTRDEPLDAGRSLVESTELEARPAPGFTMLGLHWKGTGTVSFRTRGTDGRWSEWQRAVVHELPDPAEAGSGDWQLGTPVWTGPANAVQYRITGGIRRLRAHFVRSEAGPGRSLARATRPAILDRAAWGADETIVRAPASYAGRLRLAIVHHTAGSSPATPEESAAVVRGIQAYHVEGNGWNDIGYNFLIDPFGQVFEGRVGGVNRNVIGAHALGFNTGSTGVALLGNFEGAPPTPEARAALVGLLAWRLDVGHVDPLAVVDFVSGGTTHTLRGVSGHRDVNSTACPGGVFYPDLDAIATETAGLGLPKLYEPSARIEADGEVRFSGRLSSSLPWTVTVTGASGEVTEGAGTGVEVDWTWHAAGSPDGSYGWTMGAGDDVLPATGRVRLGDVEEDPDPPPPPPPRPARPAGAPRRIPHWAFELRRWHLTPKAKRGRRPASAPRRPPAWYWPWFTWRNELKAWNELYG